MNYETIRLDKSLYKSDGGFTRQLERMDPSKQYSGTELDGLDAFQRQLKRFDIKVSGPNSDTISKFFATNDSAALFPEYVSRAVGQGCQTTENLSEILAAVTDINSLDYRSISTSLGGESNVILAEGDPLPEVSITLNDSLIHLKKRGHLLKASYEAIKHQRIDIITVALRQMGCSLANWQLKDAISVLLDGDGTVTPAQAIATAGQNWSYDDLLNLWALFEDFEINVMIASPKTVQKLMKMEEFQDVNCGNSFLTTGNIITPFGAKIIKTSAISDQEIIGLDKRFALEMVTSGGVMVEYDKLIDTQLERAAVSATYGFSKLFPEASKTLMIV